MGSYHDTARGLAIGYIVAIVVCVLFFVVVVPILGCCLYKRRQKRLRARNQAAQSAYANRNAAAVPGQTQAGYHPVPNYGYPPQTQGGQQYYAQGGQQAGVAWPQQQPQQQGYGYYGGEQKPPGV